MTGEQINLRYRMKASVFGYSSVRRQLHNTIVTCIEQIEEVIEHFQRDAHRGELRTQKPPPPPDQSRKRPRSFRKQPTGGFNRGHEHMTGMLGEPTQLRTATNEQDFAEVTGDVHRVADDV